MNISIKRWSSLLCLLIFLIPLVANSQSVTVPNPTSQNLAATNPPKATANRRKLAGNNNAAWQNLLEGGACDVHVGGAKSQECADRAVALAFSTCSSSAVIFQRGETAWTIADFAFVIASATFTGLGASATLSQAKVFSTLGGTTGLGAVTATLNANVSNNQSGVNAINQLQAGLETYILTPDAAGKLPTTDLVFVKAISTAGLCVGSAAGSSSSGSVQPTATVPATATSQSTAPTKPAPAITEPAKPDK